MKESLITALNDLAKEGNAVKPVRLHTTQWDSTLPEYLHYRSQRDLVSNAALLLPLQIYHRVQLTENPPMFMGTSGSSIPISYSQKETNIIEGSCNSHSNKFPTGSPEIRTTHKVKSSNQWSDYSMRNCRPNTSFPVDTGACLSAIDEEFIETTYGPFPPQITNSGQSLVQSVSGDTVPILEKITLPLKLSGSTYSCDFQVMWNLSYTAKLGRDFLQENQAVIDLENHSIVFKESEETQRWKCAHVSIGCRNVSYSNEAWSRNTVRHTRRFTALPTGVQ